MIDITNAIIGQMEKRYRATLINSLPGFKCLQLIGTSSDNGHSNLGLFNSIFHLGASPALLGVIFRPQSTDHDTLTNIKRTGIYTLNNVTQSFVDKAHQTSARYESGFSEFVECGLTEYYIPDFEAPFVAESSVKIGLSVKEIIPIKANDTTMVIGEIVRIQLNEDLVAADGFVDHHLAGTITVAGLDSYYATTPIARFSYAKPDRPLTQISKGKGNI
ncbi:flavin reductase family protein [Pedobacter sandarakinus]|uniref:flavin reductase family protein n=1 Tax=Pedobacter sandarakinus TaxID=353156 RepID=UPI002247252E|nr:flavin reductase [Pedobacter sandarakinus]MCX2575194.1 flavin reductase [Pedobacter sandarakinus]